MRSIEQVADELLASVLASPRHQRRMLSRTLWSLFGFGVRSRPRIAAVRSALEVRGLHLTLPVADFGAEPADSWIVLTHAPKPDEAVTDLPRRPTDLWFETMRQRRFESEREVEYYFVAPLLEALGYAEADLAIGCPVQMYEGVKRVNKEADIVVFDGESRDRASALLVVEAKRSGRPLTEDAVGQARAYALWLTTPYYVVTNGDTVRAFLFRGAIHADVSILEFARPDLEATWNDVAALLSRPAVIRHKANLLTVLREHSAPNRIIE